MTFIKPYMIRLSHCDPTGTLFHPNLFHIFNALVEDWFYEAIELRFDEFLMQRGLALPIVRMESTFSKPILMGESVDFWLTVSHIGRSSIRYTMGVDKDGEQRVRLNQISVCIDQTSREPVAIPDDMREKILAFMHA